MRIKDKEREIRKAYEAGEIKEYGDNCWSVPSRFFALGITPEMVSKVVRRIKEE